MYFVRARIVYLHSVYVQRVITREQIYRDTILNNDRLKYLELDTNALFSSFLVRFSSAILHRIIIYTARKRVYIYIYIYIQYTVAQRTQIAVVLNIFPEKDTYIRHVYRKKDPENFCIRMHKYILVCTSGHSRLIVTGTLGTVYKHKNANRFSLIPVDNISTNFFLLLFYCTRAHGNQSVPIF